MDKILMILEPAREKPQQQQVFNVCRYGIFILFDD